MDGHAKEDSQERDGRKEGGGTCDGGGMEEEKRRRRRRRKKIGGVRGKKMDCLPDMVEVRDSQSGGTRKNLDLRPGPKALLHQCTSNQAGLRSRLTPYGRVGTWDESSFPARLGSSGERHLPVKLHLRLPRVHPTAGEKRAKKKKIMRSLSNVWPIADVGPGVQRRVAWGPGIRQNRRYLCHAASGSGEGLGRAWGREDVT